VDKVTHPKGCVHIHEDFDFEDAIEHYDVTGDWKGVGRDSRSQADMTLILRGGGTSSRGQNTL
jgi:hypothetical protein